VIAATLASIYFLTQIAGTSHGAAQIALKGSAVAVLAIAAAVAARTRDGWLLAAVMALGALGDVLIEFDMAAGATAFAAGHIVAIALYLANRRPAPLPTSQKAAAVALLLAAPLLWLLAGDTKDAGIALYAALLCAMAAAAWTSRFPRYRTGIGAVLFIVSDALILARLGGNADPALAERAIWPLYAAGQILIFVGVRQTLAAMRQ
jgi:uncharacterized membrane protein YhhN